VPDLNNTAIKAVLFDLDATLADSRPIYERAFAITFKTILGIELDESERRQYMGLPTIDFLMQYADGDQLQHLTASLTEQVKNLISEVRLFPGLEEILPELWQAGFLLGVVTSQNREECLFTRKALKIDPWISIWITSEDVERVKPDAQPVQAALAALGVDADRALMVGDSIYDLKAGRAAGTYVAAAAWGAADLNELLALKPDAVFHTPLEMRSLMMNSVFKCPAGTS